MGEEGLGNGGYGSHQLQDVFKGKANGLCHDSDDLDVVGGRGGVEDVSLEPEGVMLGRYMRTLS